MLLITQLDALIIIYS